MYSFTRSSVEGISSCWLVRFVVVKIVLLSAAPGPCSKSWPICSLCSLALNRPTGGSRQISDCIYPPKTAKMGLDAASTAAGAPRLFLRKPAAIALRQLILRAYRRAVKQLGAIRQLWGRISTQKRLLLLGLISISALVTFTARVVVDRTQAVINHSVEQFGLALAQALARGGAEAMANSGNVEGLKYYVLTEMGQTPAIAYVVFCDNKGTILLDSQALPNRKEDGIYQIYRESTQARAVPGVYA